MGRNREFTGDLMRKLQFAVYLVVLVMAFCEEENIPVVPAFWHYWSRFWYELAEFSGQTGISAEHHYNESVKVLHSG